MCKGPAHPPIHHPFSDEENRCVPVLCPIWEQKKTLEEKANPEKKDVLTTKELGLEEKAD
ncbi:hypothetical protein JXB27_03000 [Candidatus Woesearchaeota archaeon]|nr:hypothetical protein [Candidatus Woesearchaeota archaeon]